VTAAARLPRPLHPVAWWVWALGLATAASRTTNPLLLAVVLAVAGLVVVTCRSDAPWARSFSAYLVLGLMVIGLRVVLHALLGAVDEGHVLLTLPEVTLPDWAAGVAVGGAVTAEGLLAALYDGLRLAVLLCCVGAANALANPKRALQSLPAALYEVGVAAVVALSVAPQLVESVQRVRRARRLRGAGGRGPAALRGIAVPVLEDALERSLALAAAMDSRGYGRAGDAPRSVRRLTGALLVGGLVGLALGLYGLLDASTPGPLAGVALALGVVLSVTGLALGGRRVHRSRYRPDPWALPEHLVAGSGVAAAAAVVVTGVVAPQALHPSLYPLQWPTLPLLATLGVLVALLPTLAAPPVPRAAREATA
jgi:energy-coupling factor transport system permease protein